MSFVSNTLGKLRKLTKIFTTRKKTRKKIYRFERLKSELERRIRIKKKNIKKEKKNKNK